MKICITGGAGYLGSELIDFLVGEHEICVIDRLDFGGDSLLRYAKGKNFNIIIRDIRDEAFAKNEVKKYDCIIQLAGLVGAPVCEKRRKEAWEINLEAHKKISAGLSKEQLEIYISTQSVYGKGSEEVHTEKSPTNPISTYAKSKLMAESISLERENSVALRFGTLFGTSARMRVDLLVNFLAWNAYSKGINVLYQSSFKRNILHILDACRSIKHCLDNWNLVKGEIFNVGLDNRGYSKMAIAQEIKKLIDHKIINRKIGKDIDQRNYLVSTEKFKKIGFGSRYSLADGILQLKTAFKLIDKPWYSNY